MSQRVWRTVWMVASTALVVGLSFYSAMGFPPPLH